MGTNGSIGNTGYESKTLASYALQRYPELKKENRKGNLFVCSTQHFDGIRDQNSLAHGESISVVAFPRLHDRH